LGDEDLRWLTVDAVRHWSTSALAYFAAVADRFHLSEDPAALYEQYRPRYLAGVRPLDGVLDGLAALRDAGWRTGIVTNGPVGPPLAKIDVLHLADLVGAVCVSEAEDCCKPDEKIFRRAAEKAGAELDGGWMTGDSLEADIAGGNAVGLTTAWVSR